MARGTEIVMAATLIAKIVASYRRRPVVSLKDYEFLDGTGIAPHASMKVQFRTEEK